MFRMDGVVSSVVAKVVQRRKVLLTRTLFVVLVSRSMPRHYLLNTYRLGHATRTRTSHTCQN